MRDSFNKKVNSVVIREPDFLVMATQKSGCYWVSALMDAHPEISCFPSMYGGQTGVGEGHVFDVLGSIDDDGGKQFIKSFTKTRDGFFADLVHYLHQLSRHKLYDLFRERYSQWCNLYRKKRLVGEKTAEYLLHLDIVDYFYPKIKKLCIIRDPKDRVVSFHFHQLRKQQKTEEKITDEYVLSYCLNRIKKEYEILLNYNGNMHCFTYEALTKNPHQVLRDILDYLEVKSTKEIVNQMIAEASFENLTKKDRILDEGSRKRGEENRYSQYRKGIVGDWKNYLTPKQTKMIDTIIFDLEKKVFQKYNLNR